VQYNAINNWLCPDAGSTLEHLSNFHVQTNHSVIQYSIRSYARDIPQAAKERKTLVNLLFSQNISPVGVYMYSIAKMNIKRVSNSPVITVFNRSYMNSFREITNFRIFNLYLMYLPKMSPSKFLRGTRIWLKKRK